MSPSVKEREPFSPTKVSPSRLNALVSCGVAFKRQYVDRIPQQRSGSAALFGRVVHKALELWGKDRQQDLLTLMREAWRTETDDTVVREFIDLYETLSTKAIRQEHAIRESWKSRGKESKAPRMTREWKESAIGRQLARLIAEWAPKLEEGSYWRFTDRDPLPALYDESLVLSRRYQAQWGHLPNALHGELLLNEPWRGFTINGYPDSIELLLERESKELLGVGVIDYKTYSKEPPEYKDWRQVTMYDVAVRGLVERGALQLPVDIEKTPLYVGIDYVRLGVRRFWQVEEADYERLERELKAYKTIVESQAFLPADKSRNPDFCDYPEECCLRTTEAAGGCSERVEVNL